MTQKDLDFLIKIVTCDETWVHFYESEIQIETSTKMYTPFLIGLN